MRTIPHTLGMTVLVWAWLAGSAAAQDHGAHDGHGAQHEAGGHQGHGMADTPQTGSWSYHDRATPETILWERWDMIPVAGSHNAFVAVAGASLEERCARYRDNVSTILDRTLLSACGAMVPQDSGPETSDTDHHQQPDAHHHDME